MRWALVFALAACGDGGKTATRTLYTGDVWGGNLAVADGIAYWTTYNEGGPGPNEIGLYAAPLDGSAVATRLSVGNSHGIPGYGMTVAGGRVFWSGQLGDGMSGAAVFGDSIAGGDRTPVAMFSTGTAPRGIDHDASYLYAGGQELLRIPLAGGAAEAIGPATRWLAVDDPDHLIVLDASRSLTRRALSTSAVETISTTDGLSFAFDGFAIFIPTADGVMRIVPSTRRITQLGLNAPVSSLGLFGDSVIAASGDDLYRVPKDGDDAELILAHAGAVFAIVPIDGGVVVASCSCGPVGGGSGSIEILDL